MTDDETRPVPTTFSSHSSLQTGCSDQAAWHLQENRWWVHDQQSCNPGKGLSHMPHEKNHYYTGIRAIKICRIGLVGISPCWRPGSILNKQGADQKHPQQLQQTARQSWEDGGALQGECNWSPPVRQRAQVFHYCCYYGSLLCPEVLDWEAK